MYKVDLLKGDYAGPEGMKEAIKVLDACSKKHKCEYMIEELLASGEAYDIYQNNLPQIMIDKAKTCDALLKGPFGSPASELNNPKWQNVDNVAM